MSLLPPLDLSRFLSSREWEDLGAPSAWKWVASVGQPDVAPIRHRRHEAWIKDRAHVWRPEHRDVMLTLRGRSVYGFNGKVYRRQPGLVMLFDVGESRDYKGAPYQNQEAYSCLWLHLHDACSLFYQIRGVDAHGQLFRPVPMRIKSDRSALLIATAWDRCREVPGDPWAWVYLKTMIGATLMEILATASAEPSPEPRRQLIVTMQRYIDRNVAGELSLHHLANIAGYSPFFFHRIFRQQTGQTPQAYVSSVRLERAKELLRARQTVESVAEQVGMASVSYFRRFFKRYTGCSPGRWLKSSSN